jgi:hypothetical protein
VPLIQFPGLWQILFQRHNIHLTLLHQNVTSIFKVDQVDQDRLSETMTTEIWIFHQSGTHRVSVLNRDLSSGKAWDQIGDH